MINRLQWIAYGIGSLVFIGVGFALGSQSAARAHEKEISRVQKVGTDLLRDQLAETKVCERERDQHAAEVAKINESTAAQYKLILDTLQADQASRDVALAKVERSARVAAAEAKSAGEKAAQAREVIQNVADQCARAGVPDDVVRMLNEIIISP